MIGRRFVGRPNFADVQAAIKTYRNGDGTARLIWADVEPGTPNRIANFNKVLWPILAFIGEPYPFSTPVDCA